jgi:hypothetical protein
VKGDDVVEGLDFSRGLEGEEGLELVRALTEDHLRARVAEDEGHLIGRGGVEDGGRDAARDLCAVL